MTPPGGIHGNPPFAYAFMTVSNAYSETFRENVSLVQAANPPSLVTISTNTFAPTGVDPSEMHPDGGTWLAYLWDNWSFGVSSFSGQIYPGLSAATERYDSNGLLIPGDFYNMGAWKEAVQVASQVGVTNVPMPAINRTESSFTNYNSALYTNTFVNRSVYFNYTTVGWTATNILEVVGPAPAFNGRLVVEDAIRQLPGLEATNLVINGQVTYTHRIKDFSLQEDMFHNYTVNHTRATMPVQPVERIYDIRISSVNVNPL
jgi:hypothetical protein